MKLSIYLHKPVVSILKCYGDLDDVVNRMLTEGANGEFDVTHKPSAPDRNGAGRYDIEVTEPNYLELLETYGPFSSIISLRRLIYWFVENEIYNELEWEPINTYEDKNIKLFKRKLSNSLNEIEKAKAYCTSKYIGQLTIIADNIKLLKEMLDDR